MIVCLNMLWLGIKTCSSVTDYAVLYMTLVVLDNWLWLH